MIVVAMDRGRLPTPLSVLYRYLYKFGPTDDMYLLFSGGGPAKNEDERVITFCKELVELGGLTILGSADLADSSNRTSVALLSGHLPYTRNGDMIEIVGDLDELVRQYTPELAEFWKVVAEDITLGAPIRSLKIDVAMGRFWVQ